MEVSPADTFDTVPLDQSPSQDYLPTHLNFESPQKGSKIVSNKKNGNTQKVVIEHKMKGKGGNGGGSRSLAGYMCLIKPLLLFLFIAVCLAGAASVYGWLFKFPDLNRQVKELEGQISRLQAENDRYEELNDLLNITTADLELVRDDLNGTAFQLENVALALNTTADQVIAVISDLQGQNMEYALLNQGLQTNVEDLAGEVDFFREALEDLTSEHSVLQETTTALQGLLQLDRGPTGNIGSLEGDSGWIPGRKRSPRGVQRKAREWTQLSERDTLCQRKSSGILHQHPCGNQ